MLHLFQFHLTIRLVISYCLKYIAFFLLQIFLILLKHRLPFKRNKIYRELSTFILRLFFISVVNIEYDSCYSTPPPSSDTNKTI